MAKTEKDAGFDAGWRKDDLYTGDKSADYIEGYDIGWAARSQYDEEQAARQIREHRIPA